MIKNTSAFRKPIDRKTEDYVIVKGSKTKAMPEHKNNLKFFPLIYHCKIFISEIIYHKCRII